MHVYSLQVDAIRKILPKDVLTPGGFETVGKIIHLNINKDQEPYKMQIGQILLDALILIRKHPELRPLSTKKEKSIAFTGIITLK